MAMNADLNAAAGAGDIEGLYTLIENDPHVLENIDNIPFVNTPLHVAASAGRVGFERSTDLNADLNAAAGAGDIEGLYRLIENDPHVLKNIDNIPFVNTPLHVAASAGRVGFATEIIRLMPSFAGKLNTQGLSPMHLALQTGHDSMVRRFVSINKELVRVKGKEGLTPLHHAAANNEKTVILAEFLAACPDSIEDLTVEGETALHIAVKERQFEALQVLVGWVRRSSDDLRELILNWKNESEETILHVSTRNQDPRAVIKCLIESGINVNARNRQGSTALDIVEQFPNEEIMHMLVYAEAKRGIDVAHDDPTLADRLMSEISIADKLTSLFGLARRATVDDTTRNASLAVAVLMATMAYQSALSPPGGVHQAADIADSTQGKRLLKGSSVMPAVDFALFWFFNTCCLVVSTMVFYFLLPPLRMVTALLMGAVVYFTIIYLLAMRIISPIRVLSDVNFSLVMVVLVTIYSGLLLLKNHLIGRLERMEGNWKMESMPASGGNRW